MKLTVTKQREYNVRNQSQRSARKNLHEHQNKIKTELVQCNELQFLQEYITCGKQLFLENIFTNIYSRLLLQLDLI